MTDGERSMVARALERADRLGVHIVAHGTVNDTGEPAWIVSSGSRANVNHVVTLADEHHLRCDCKAAEHGAYCMHRAVCHAELVEQHVARHPVTTPTTEQRDTAPLRRSNQPFQFMR